MHKRIYDHFAGVCADLQPRLRVLELGAVPTADSLLHLFGDADFRVGVNLSGPYECDGFQILKGNANHLDDFPDASFDIVLSNAMIEHDRYFWLTAAEARRVLKPGGHLVIGSPGIVETGFDRFRTRWKAKHPRLRRWLVQFSLFDLLLTATPTFQVHAAPGDFYRLSDSAFREVLFQDLNVVSLDHVLWTPRIIGVAQKPT